MITRKTPMQTVLLNGRHSLPRAFLRAWLGRFSDLKVVAEAATAAQTMALVQKHKPSLVLMEFDTLHGAGMEVLNWIRQGYPSIKVIVYHAHPDDLLAIKAIHAGAAGFVLKSADSGDMESAVRIVLGGGVYMTSKFLRSMGAAGIGLGVTPPASKKPVKARKHGIKRG